MLPYPPLAVTGTNAGGGSALNTSTVSGGSGPSGVPSPNTSDATTAVNQSNTTGITAALGSGIASLPPYIGLYKMMRVL